MTKSTFELSKVVINKCSKKKRLRNKILYFSIPLICSGNFKCSKGCPSISVGRIFSNRFSQNNCLGFVFSLGFPPLLAVDDAGLLTCGLTSSRCVG